MAATDSIAPLIGRSLSGSVEVGDHPTDDRIMDAVVEEVRVGGFRNLALDGVARRAGLSRMTIYRRFGDRERLIEVTTARETARLLTAVAAADDPKADPVERISTSFATGLTAAHGHPLVRRWLAVDPGEVLDGLLADDAQVLRTGAAFMVPSIREMSPGRGNDADARRLAEILVRLFAALVLMPPESIDLTDPDEAKALARELIAPLVVGRS